MYVHMTVTRPPADAAAVAAADGPISVGWGWGAESYAANNTIVGNNAHDVKWWYFLDLRAVRLANPKSITISV